MIAYLRGRAGVLVLAGAVVALTLGLQSWHVGFWTPGHGWTSAHGLALMTHATPENGFVAYSQAFIDADGNIEYEYFDRYPPGFAAFSRLLLLITDDLPLEVYIMRQYMNVIYLLLLFGAYRLARTTLENRYLALAATVLAGGSYHMLYYKDMIHYDTPAVMGLFWTSYLIVRYQRGQAKGWQVAALAVFFVSYGRGYVLGFLLAAWAAWDGLATLRGGAGLRGVLRRASLWVLVLAVGWGSGWLAYNTLMEARTRGVPIAETSIVDSARRQLPFTDPANNQPEVTGQANQEQNALAWSRFIVTQTERIGLWAVPLRLAGDMPWRYYPLRDPFALNPARLGLALVVFGLAGWGLGRAMREARVGVGVAVAGGLLWLYVMFSLSTAHIYVTMYALPLVLAAYTGLLRPLARWQWAGALLAVGSVAAYGGTAWQVRATQAEEMQTAAAYTEDFSRVREVIRKDWQVSYFAPDFGRGTCIIRQDICFAPGYYLGDKHLLTLEPDAPADFVLSPNGYRTEPRFVDPGGATRLTLPYYPQNQQVHVYDANGGQPRTAPATLEPTHRFGDVFGLGGWALNGDHVVPPCGDVWVESWWAATQPPPTNYNMQVVMVTEDGRELSSSNRPLGNVPTSIWESDRYMLDARRVVVPCGTPPGSYPLIMGVYEAASLAILPVSAADETPLDNQLYLTNIVVPGEEKADG